MTSVETWTAFGGPEGGLGNVYTQSIMSSFRARAALQNLLPHTHVSDTGELATRQVSGAGTVHV